MFLCYRIKLRLYGRNFNWKKESFAVIKREKINIHASELVVKMTKGSVILLRFLASGF